MSAKEAFSRVVIDRKLREAGWNIEDASQVVFEDHGDAGRADYVLKDGKGSPIAIIEAKAPDINPYTAKKQARDYVELQYPMAYYISTEAHPPIIIAEEDMGYYTIEGVAIDVVKAVV